MARSRFVSLLLLFIPISVLAQQFVPQCKFKGQLRTLAQKRAIDTFCPNVGKGGDDSKAQNVAKNNFCASNIPVEVNIATLRSLESRTQDALNTAGIPFGSPTTIPPDRDRLRQGFTVDGQTFKEGMTVFIRAFVLDAHYSNLGKGESVNCKVGKKANNDIHVSLGATPGSEECNGVTAEISPHFRPTTWADFDDYLFTHPVMMMGQLFYDASHKPCTPGHPVNPARISSWEIHPVYSIYVCKNATLAACPSDPTDPRWVPFHKWVLQPDDEVPSHHSKGGFRRTAHFSTIEEILLQSTQSHGPRYIWSYLNL